MFKLSIFLETYSIDLKIVSSEKIELFELYNFDVYRIKIL